MPSESVGLVAEDVSFGYGDLPAVVHARLALVPGDMLALAGPNGSGKTTVLKLLAGDLRSQTGQVMLDGVDLRHQSPRARARRIAVVPQHVDPALGFPVRAVVAMGRSPYTGWFGTIGDGDRSAITRALEDTDVLSLADRPFNTLSGGEQQRVSLAMALAQDTSYLLLDEPTVHLDLQHQHQLLELLRHLQQQRGLGVVAVMHDLNLAALYFDTVTVLQHGRVVAAGQTGDVLRDPNALAVFGAPLRLIDHPDNGVPQLLLRRG